MPENKETIDSYSQGILPSCNLATSNLLLLAKLRFSHLRRVRSNRAKEAEGMFLVKLCRKTKQKKVGEEAQGSVKDIPTTSEGGPSSRWPRPPPKPRPPPPLPPPKPPLPPPLPAPPPKLPRPPPLNGGLIAGSQERKTEREQEQEQVCRCRNRCRCAGVQGQGFRLLLFSTNPTHHRLGELEWEETFVKT